MTSRFTELETETYYDAQDAIYRSIWDEDGAVHWGIFDDPNDTDFPSACERLNETMVQKAAIDRDSHVLDLGCGNGTIAIWLTGDTEASVTGIDLSGVRIANAQHKLASLDHELQSRLRFEKASATDLPFSNGSFSHVWSQAVIYHVPDKRKVLEEIHRVLSKDGILVFDDLFRPTRDITPEAQTYVYDRLLFDTEFTFDSYRQALKDQGFEVLEALDLSPHLKRSYLSLEDRIPTNGAPEDAEHYRWLAKAYVETAAAVDKGEVGWGLFVCRK